MPLLIRALSPSRLKALKTLTGALLPLLLAAPAHASLAGAASKAYKCLEANGEALLDGAEKGAKVMYFIASKPLCVAQLVTPPPYIPQISMGLTVGIATQQSLKSYDSCTDRIYGFVAHPILDAVKTALDKAPGLPPPLDSLKTGLADLAVENAVDLLTSIPGTEVVTGGIDCGCALVGAGLKPETVIQLYNSSKKVVKQCSAVLDELGAVGKGLVAVGGAVATGWNDVVNDPQHMPVNSYYKLHWEPYVESVAQGLAAVPPRDVWTPTVRPVFDRCVKYFDGHNQYHDTAVLTCNGMRDGTRDFNGAGFTRGVYNRTWDLITPGAVEYYGRYLAKQQGDQARAAGLNDALARALASRLFRDFGLDSRGNAKRGDQGDVQWATGTVGDKTTKAKGLNFSGGDPTKRANELPNRDLVLSALISKAFNGGPTLAAILGWQKAYAAIKVAKCTMQPSPPPIRNKGESAAQSQSLSSVALICADLTQASSLRQAAASACSALADSLKKEINLACPGSADLIRPELSVGGATYNGRVILVRGSMRYTADGVQIGDPAVGNQTFAATFGILPMRTDWVNGVMGSQQGAQKTLHFLVQITTPAGFNAATPGKLFANSTSANFDAANFTVTASKEPPSATLDGVTLAPPAQRADMICRNDECREELIRMTANCKKQFNDFAKKPANQSGDVPQLSLSKQKEQAAILAECEDKMRAFANSSVASGANVQPNIGGGGKLPGNVVNPGVPAATAPPTLAYIPPLAVAQPPTTAAVRLFPILVPPTGGQLGAGQGGALSSQLGVSGASGSLGNTMGGNSAPAPFVSGCTSQPNNPGNLVCQDVAAKARCEQASRGRGTCTLRLAR